MMRGREIESIPRLSGATLDFMHAIIFPFYPSPFVKMASRISCVRVRVCESERLGRRNDLNV